MLVELFGSIVACSAVFYCGWPACLVLSGEVWRCMMRYIKHHQLTSSHRPLRVLCEFELSRIAVRAPACGPLCLTVPASKHAALWLDCLRHLVSLWLCQPVLVEGVDCGRPTSIAAQEALYKGLLVQPSVQRPASTSHNSRQNRSLTV